MFFKHFLGIPNVKSEILKDPLQFLRDVVKAYVVRYPFQNITSFGQHKPLDRLPPGRRAVMMANFLGGGGLCGHNNPFLKMQLEAVGFEVQQLNGAFVRTGVPNSHNLFAVQIPKHLSKEKDRKDKKYLIDVGCGVPLSEPVCLDQLPYVSRAGGLNFRYEQIDKDTVRRINECGDAIIGKRPKDFESPQDYVVNLTTIEQNEIAKAVEIVFSKIRGSFFHQGLYCFRYLHFEEDDFEIVCICGKELIFITKETRKTQSFDSYVEMLPVIHKYFPMINPEEVDLAIENFSLPFEEAIKLSKNYNPSSNMI